MSYADLARLLTFRPLERPIDCSFHAAPFTASWSSTINTLTKELRAHGARNTVLEIDFRESDLRLDGLPRADRRAASPGIVLSFDAHKVPGRPHLRYEVGTYATWQNNIRAVALALEALRAVDRYGVTRRGEQYAGWRQLVAGTGEDEGNPARGRQLVEKAGSIAKALYAAHPDHGGEPQDFRDVIAYREQREGRT